LPSTHAVMPFDRFKDILYFPAVEIEVTKKILAKDSRLCLLLSHSRGYFSRLEIF
jgi:hypothetical protein